MAEILRLNLSQPVLHVLLGLDFTRVCCLCAMPAILHGAMRPASRLDWLQAAPYPLLFLLQAQLGQATEAIDMNGLLLPAR